MRRAVAILTLAGALLPASAQAASTSQTTTSPSEIAEAKVVVLHDDVGDVDGAVRRLEDRGGFRAEHRYRTALRGFATRLTPAQQTALEGDAAVRAVVADRPFSADGKSTGVTPTPVVTEIVPPGVRRMRARSTATAGVAGAAVAVLDTGVDLRSTDLDARHGVNCVTSTAQAQDDNGHGTHVAGTIAARSAGSGVVGVAAGTTVYAVKVLNSRKAGTLSQLLCGIDWVTGNAAALGIRVANMSLSGTGGDDGRCGQADGDVQHQAICRSIGAGVTYVASAGNAGRDLGTAAPASYGEVLAVTAMSDADGQAGGVGAFAGCKTTERDDRAGTYSNYATTDAHAVHTIAAPGTCVLSSKLGGGTVVMTGTSMAAPHVAGAASACTAAGGSCAGLPPADVVRRLRSLAAEAAPGRGFAGDPQAPTAGRFYGHLVDAATP